MARGYLHTNGAAKVDKHLIGNAVKNLIAFAAPRQHAGLKHGAEMAGHIGLGGTGLRNDVGDAFFFMTNGMKNT